MIYKFNTIDSTNLEAIRNNEQYNSFDVIVSNKQTNGYGRRGTKWIDSEGLFYTMIIKDLDLNKILELPFITCYSVMKVLNNIGINSLNKWPNDIIVNDKKISGILVENKTTYTLIGIGLNINKVEYDKAISLRELNSNITFDELIELVTNELIHNIHNISFEEVIEYLNNNSYLTGKEITYNDNTYKVINIDISGSLKVANNHEIILINTGSITLTNMYK